MKRVWVKLTMFRDGKFFDVAMFWTYNDQFDLHVKMWDVISDLGPMDWEVEVTC